MEDDAVEYPELDDDFLRELEANAPPAPPPRKRSILEACTAWAFYEFIYNTEFFGERLIRTISRYGERRSEKYSARLTTISQATVDAFRIGVGEPPTYSSVSPRKRLWSSCSFLDPAAYTKAVSRMSMVCRIQADHAERNAMELGLPMDTAHGIAVFFFLPAFYWSLAASLFAKP